MIFNKNKNGAKELRELTGSYYANNSFSKISGDIEVATEELTVLIGEPVMQLAEKYYQNGEDNELVRKVQRPIAIMATLGCTRRTTSVMKMMAVSSRWQRITVKSFLGMAA